MLKKQSGYTQSLISIVGNFLATGLSAIAIILISRMLGPEQFGIFSVGFSLVLILTRINEVGLNTAIVKFASKHDDISIKNAIYSITLRYKLIISLFLLLIGIAGADVLAQHLNFPHPTIIRIAFSVGLVTVYYEQLLYTLQSVHHFTQSVAINAIQATVKLLGALTLLVIGKINVSLIFFLYIIAPIAPIIFHKYLLPGWHNINLTTQNVRVRNQLFGLAKHSSIALISAGVIENIDVLFVQRYLTTYETGLYGGVSRIAMMFALVAYSLANVLNARVAKYHLKSDLAPYLKKATLVAIASAVAFLLFIPFSKPLIMLTIGNQYLAGNSMLILLTGSSFLAIAAIPFIALFYSFNTDWYFSLSGILQLIIVLVGNLIFVPVYGLEAAAWTRVATRLFLFIFVVALSLVLYYRKYIQHDPAQK